MNKLLKQTIFVVFVIISIRLFIKLSENTRINVENENAILESNKIDRRRSGRKVIQGLNTLDSKDPVEISEEQKDVGLNAFGPSDHGQKVIPKIIHQIWNDEILPGEFVANVQSLTRDNPSPEWKYYFWTKDSGLKFIGRKFPFLFERANDTHNLLRSDLLRYLVIYEYGGIYFDLDTVSVKPLTSFVTSHRCAFPMEPDEHYFAMKGRDFFITNSALFCVRRHPFYTNLLLHFTSKLKKTCQFANSCTGPIMLTWLYKELNKTDNYAGELPDAISSEYFQDKYDHGLQRKRLEYNCFNASVVLLPYQKKICENWVARGKQYRNLSEKAITYHTWFHILNKRLKISEENHIKKLVPHAQIYGKDFS